MKLHFLTVGMLLCSFSQAQYCVSGGPTTTVDSNVQSVQITGSVGSISFTGCPGVMGVQNLTALSTTLNATNSYNLNVHFGTCNGNYFGAGEAWIDFDQNSTFDPGESLGTWSGTPPVATSVFTFTVPANAQNGTTRMRVMQHEGTSPPLDPCASFPWGSVMDFSIVITGGISCIGYVGDDMNDPKIVTAMPYTDNADNSYCYFNQNPVYPSPDVYYRVIPSVGSTTIHASLCGSTFDTFLSVIDPQGNFIAYNDDAPTCSPQSDLYFSTTGLDTVFIIVEGWGMQMGAYTLNLNEDLVGVQEVSGNDFSIYPNPTQNDFTITGNVRGEIVLSDVVGNTIREISNYQGEQISTEGISPGIYFVKFEFAGNNFSKKIIIGE